MSAIAATIAALLAASGIGGQPPEPKSNAGQSIQSVESVEGTPPINPSPQPVATHTPSTRVSQPAPAKALTERPLASSPKVGGGDSLLDCIARYESNGYGDKRNPAYRGRYAFHRTTWASVGGAGDPADASPAEQDKRARILIGREGLKPWPVPSRYCRGLL